MLRAETPSIETSHVQRAKYFMEEVKALHNGLLMETANLKRIIGIYMYNIIIVVHIIFINLIL